MVADPDGRNAQRMLALAHQGLGTVNLLLRQLQKALDHARLAVDLLEKLATADPQDAAVGHALGRAYAPLADIQTRLGDFAEAREAKLKRLLIMQKWAAADRDNLTLQTDLSFAYCELGRTEMNLRRYEEAARDFQQGAAILQNQQRQGKLRDQPGSERMLAVMEHKLSICRAAGRAIEDLEFVLKQKPAVAAELLYIRAAVLAGRGQHIAAADAADKLCRMDPKNISNLYDAACAYALCAAGVAYGKSPGQLSAEEAAARKRYADRALETLSALTQLGFKDAANFEIDPDFAAIRQEEGYRRLLASLKTPLTKNK
jgi:tetratricopeptide (TPR) repeat protein